MNNFEEIQFFLAVERQRQMQRFIFMAKWKAIGDKYKQSL